MSCMSPSWCGLLGTLVCLWHLKTEFKLVKLELVRSIRWFVFKLLGRFKAFFISRAVLKQHNWLSAKWRAQCSAAETFFWLNLHQLGDENDFSSQTSWRYCCLVTATTKSHQKKLPITLETQGCFVFFLLLTSVYIQWHFAIRGWHHSSAFLKWGSLSV